MIVDDGALAEVTTMVWETMLGLPLVTSLEEGQKKADLRSEIDVSGDWAGTIGLQMSAPMARKAASALFGCAPEQASSDEVKDAASELANMIGGAVKSLLLGSCRLGLPRVLGDVPAPGTAHEQTMSFEFEGDAILVTLDRRAA